MSRRTLNQSEGSSNPATKFLEWKSKDKCFAYYDKVKKENVKIPMPLKFQFLEHFHNVRGWNDASSSGIYSNEVKFISKEPLKVKSFKGGEIAEGIYSEIRSKLRDAGGKYHRSVYVVLDGEIVNLQLKGACVSAYSDFMQNHENQLEGSWTEVASVTDHKKGATKYSTPDFTVGPAFTPEEMKLANDKYTDVSEYFNNYTKKAEPEVEEESPEDMPF
tara:strand:+ start:24 stop:677 length:654 start_codon:yes stop_codon:yes gene_type:complete